MASVVEKAVTTVETVAEATPVVVDTVAGNLAEQAATAASDATTAAEASTNIQALIEQFNETPTEEVADQLAAAEDAGTLKWEDDKPITPAAVDTEGEESPP